MNKKLLLSNEIKNYFLERDYNCICPHRIVNNNDTVFITAGIQSILYDYRNHKVDNYKKIYLSQPVIRTQFAEHISEGSSIAFVNSTTAGFNISESEHDELIRDWMELFCELGIKATDISKKSKDYERIWGDLVVSGKKTFYYYNNIELGDATFFTSVKRGTDWIGIDSMSDIGFGLERLRWCVTMSPYFDLYSDSSLLSPSVKAYLSVLALLNVNDVKPSNKNSGYRLRLFSKKLVNILNGKKLSEFDEAYLMECIKYWKDWQEVQKDVDFNIIKTEYIRNCNRYIIDKLIDEGYKNLSGININISREELEKRLISANVEAEKVKKLLR